MTGGEPVRGPSVHGPMPAPERLEQRLSIARDGMIVVRSGKVEYGQGIRSGFAAIVARELCVPIERVRIELGETDSAPWDMGTFGSLSTATDGPALRAAAVTARRLLLERASDRLGLPLASLRLRDGQIAAADGRALSYTALTEGEPLAGAVRDADGGEPPCAATDACEPAPIERLEARDIVLGRPRFCADVRLPGMLYARTLHGPAPRARLQSLEAREAEQLPGVRAVIVEGDLVGVIAERDRQALDAIGALRATWRMPSRGAERPLRIEMRRDAAVDRALAGAARTLTAAYQVPHIAHAPIAPSAAVADVRAADVELYVATQNPFDLRSEVAALLGRSEQHVHVHPQGMGGLFGRGNVHDAALEVVRLSHAVGQPVLLQWSREQEFRASPHRPVLDAELHAGVDADGTISAWRCLTRTNPHSYADAAGLDEELLAMTCGRNAVPPYRLPAAHVRIDVQAAELRTGAMRSLAAAPNTFANESFIDELARACGEDPLAYRLRHADDARLRRVLETVAQRCGWRQRPQQPGRGYGIACAIYHGTYVAQVAQVRLAEGLRIEHVWCAVDAGELIWPEGARNQIEGGIQQAASWAMLEQLVYRQHCVTGDTWHAYPIATCRDAPRDIDVAFVHAPDLPPTGIGEPGTVPIAAALANAIDAAGGGRRRRLPLARGERDDAVA